MAGDIDRLLHGTSAAGAVAFRSISTAANASSVVFTATQEAEHRLVNFLPYSIDMFDFSSVTSKRISQTSPLAEISSACDSLMRFMTF